MTRLARFISLSIGGRVTGQRGSSPSRRHAFGRRAAGLLATIAVACLLATPFSPAPEPPPTDPPDDLELRAHPPRLVRDVMILETDPPDPVALLAEDRDRPAGAPLRVAVAAEVHVDLLTTPSSPTPEGRVHRLEVHSRGATSLSVALGTFHMPARAELWLVGPGERLGPFGAPDARMGELWTPAVAGDRLTIELRVDHAAAFEPDVVLTRVHHGYRAFGPKAAALPRTDGSCHVDAACSDAPELAGPIRSVAVYTVQGTHTCSGQLIDSATSEPIPYFLTADHCGVTSTNAHTVQVYWNVVSPACGARCCGDRSLTQSGALLRARYEPTDMCLLELVASPPEAARAYLTGWDARPGVTPGRTTAIHHPLGAEKAISVNEDPVEPSSYLSALANDGTHLRVDGWELGSTEPGSSGSGLWSASGHLIGQLHGGYAACGSDLADWYGRLARSFEGGGTRATRLRDWLDPAGITLGVRDGRPFSDRNDPAAVTLPHPGRLLAPAPNPTFRATRLRWEIETPGHVDVSVVDARGRHLATLAAFDAEPGSFEQTWDGTLRGGSPAPPGVYLVRLAHDGRTVSGAKVVIRR